MKALILGALALGILALVLVSFLYIPAHTCSYAERQAADRIVMRYELDLIDFAALGPKPATPENIAKGATLLVRIDDFKQPRCGDEPLDIPRLLR